MLTHILDLCGINWLFDVRRPVFPFPNLLLSFLTSKLRLPPACRPQSVWKEGRSDPLLIRLSHEQELRLCQVIPVCPAGPTRGAFLTIFKDDWRCRRNSPSPSFTSQVSLGFTVANTIKRILKSTLFQPSSRTSASQPYFFHLCPAFRISINSPWGLN